MTTLHRTETRRHGGQRRRRRWRVVASSVAAALLVVATAGAQQSGNSETKDEASAPAKPRSELTLKTRAPEAGPQQSRQGRSLAALAATIKLSQASSGTREIVITNENLSELGEGGRLTTVNSPVASVAPLLGGGEPGGAGRGVGPQQIAAQQQKIDELRAEYERMSELNKSVQDPYNPYSPHYRPGGVENPLQNEAARLKSELDQAERQLQQMRDQQRRSQR